LKYRNSIRKVLNPTYIIDADMQIAVSGVFCVYKQTNFKPRHQSRNYRNLNQTTQSEFQSLLYFKLLPV